MNRKLKKNTVIEADRNQWCFISHSHRDAELANAFLAMLQEGTGINGSRDIYMSSNTWSATRAGSDEHSALRELLKNSEIKIAIITPHSLQSETCNAELGHMWAGCNHDGSFFPFGFKLPEEKKKLPWYIQDMKCFDLSNQGHLSDLSEKICKILANKKLDWSTRNWTAASKKFLEEAPKLIGDVADSIDYESMRDFLIACESKTRIIFFNVQLSFEDWFQPELQTHLALQDASRTYYQLNQLINIKDDDPATNVHQKLPGHFATPISRVMFVKERWDDLRKMLSNPSDPKARCFVDLVLIHLLMGIPLAIVTVDLIDDIMRNKPKHINEINFQDPQTHYESVLDLPRFNGKRNEQEEEKQLEVHLSRMSNATGKGAPGIDFAMLIGPDEDNIEIWRGCIDFGKTHYYKVDPGHSFEIFTKFAYRLDQAVFKWWNEESDLMPISEEEKLNLHLQLSSHIDGRLRNYHQLLAAKHPPFKVFHEMSKVPKIRKKFLNIMNFVKPEYCPLRLIDLVQDWDKIFRLKPEL